MVPTISLQFRYIAVAIVVVVTTMVFSSMADALPALDKVDTVDDTAGCLAVFHGTDKVCFPAGFTLPAGGDDLPKNLMNTNKDGQSCASIKKVISSFHSFNDNLVKK
jgi:hypothetical protein